MSSGVERLASTGRALDKVQTGLKLVDTVLKFGEGAGLPLIPAVCSAARGVLQVVQASQTVLKDALSIAHRTIDVLELLQLMAENVERMEAKSRPSVEDRMRELQQLLEDARSAVAAFGKKGSLGWLRHALKVGRRSTLSQLDSDITGQLELLLKFYHLARDASRDAHIYAYIDARLQAREYATVGHVRLEDLSSAGPECRRLSMQPILAALPSISVATLPDEGSSSVGQSSSTSSQCGGSPASSIMTITMEGSLSGPPPFDCQQFKEKLASMLDMTPEHFKVKTASRGGRRQHDFQTSPGLSIRVEVDEEGYLRYESSRTESSSSEDEVGSVDSNLSGNDIQTAVRLALRPQRRTALEAIDVLWTEEGSIIVCVKLDLPYALKLMDLYLRGDSVLKYELRVFGHNTGIQGSSTAPAPNVPEIVVIGEQSSGKSSVLNLVADAQCPVLMTDPDTGTRMPTKLQLLQESTEKPWLLMYCEGEDHEGGPGKGNRYTGDQLSQAALNAAFKAKQDEVAGNGFDGRPIVIEYHGPVRQPVTLIDLMGFAESKFINGEPQGPKIRKITEQFVDVPSNRVPPVVVCVMSAETHVENDATVNFIRKLQREGKFSPRELVIVHNKLDRAEHGPEGLARKIKLIHSPDGIEGVHITHFGIKALFGPDGAPQPLTTEELTYWATGIAGCGMRPRELSEQCYLHGNGAAVAFGADLLGTHLKKVLSEKFRETLRGRAGLEKQLEDAIDREKYIVDSIPAPLPADKSTIRTILELAYTQFTIAFTSAGLVGGSSTPGTVETEKAREVLEHAIDQACRLIEGHKRRLLEADERKSLLDNYREQKQSRVDRADNILVVNQLMKHMDLGTSKNAGLVDELHSVLAKCMRDLTETLVYPALCEFPMGTGSDGRQTLYNISPAGPYSNLFKELNDWIVESFHGLTDDPARTQNSAWRKIRPSFDQHGYIRPSIPFDAHQHLHSALKSTSFAFTARELKKVPEAKMRDAMQVLRQDKDKLLKLQGTPCFNQVVSPKSLELLEKLITICETATKYPTYYSPHIDQIRTPEGSGAAATRSDNVRSLTEWVRRVTAEIVERGGAPPPPHELPIECSGVYEYINSNFSWSKKGEKRFMRIDDAGVLKSWPNRDCCKMLPVQTDLKLLRAGNYTVECDDKGSVGWKFRLELRPDPQAKGLLQQIYSFTSAHERNEWLKVFESFLPTPDEIIQFARDTAEAHVAHEQGLPSYTDIKDELSKKFGPKVPEQPHVKQRIQELLAELHTQREAAPDGGEAAAAAAPTDSFYDMLKDLRDDLQRKEAAAKVVEEALYPAYREYQQRRGDDTPLHRGDGNEDGVVDIAWRVKKEYSNGAEFLCGELKKHIRKVFEYVTENMMADNLEYKNRFITNFDSKSEAEVRLMFDTRADLEQQRRKDAQEREQLYLRAKDECRKAMSMLPAVASGAR